MHNIRLMKLLRETDMRYLLVVLLVTVSSAAYSQEAIHCEFSGNDAMCEWGSTRPPNARIINIPPDNSQAALDRVRKWEQQCQPTPVVDKYGVARMRYAKAGCEFGVY